MRKAFHLVAVFAACSLLAGCLVPEKFTASVQVNPDASYLYRYQGTAVHAMAAMAIKSGRFGAKDDEVLKKEAAQANRKDNPDGVRKFDYLGKGRYEVQLEQLRKPGQVRASETLDLVKLTKEKDDSYTLASPELKEKERRELGQLGIKIDGKLEVILPPKAEVISHNATGTPGWFSKTYTWKIGGLDQRPTIRFRLAAK